MIFWPFSACNSVKCLHFLIICSIGTLLYTSSFNLLKCQNKTKQVTKQAPLTVNLSFVSTPTILIVLVALKLSTSFPKCAILVSVCGFNLMYYPPSFFSRNLFAIFVPQELSLFHAVPSQILSTLFHILSFKKYYFLDNSPIAN